MAQRCRRSAAKIAMDLRERRRAARTRGPQNSDRAGFAFGRSPGGPRQPLASGEGRAVGDLETAGDAGLDAVPMFREPRAVPRRAERAGSSMPPAFATLAAAESSPAASPREGLRSQGGANRLPGNRSIRSLAYQHQRGVQRGFDSDFGSVEKRSRRPPSPSTIVPERSLSSSRTSISSTPFSTSRSDRHRLLANPLRLPAEPRSVQEAKDHACPFCQPCERVQPMSSGSRAFRRWVPRSAQRTAPDGVERSRGGPRSPCSLRSRHRGHDQRP